VTPDVSVLIAAFRRDHPHHDVAHAWLEKARSPCAEGSATLTLMSMVLVSFLRLVTDSRVFVNPDSIEDAVASSMLLSVLQAWSFARLLPSGRCFARSC
jgi:predicted nucleic acid-binding protein